MKDIKDPIVESVVERIIERSNEGIETYGTTLAENNFLDIIDWIKNAQEEAIDMVLYLEKLKDVLSKKFYLEGSFRCSLEIEKSKTEYWKAQYENLKQLNNK